MKIKLSVDRCPIHGFYAVCVGDENSSTRLTPSKCCGRWDEVKSWQMSPIELRNAAREFIALADEADKGAEQ